MAASQPRAPDFAAMNAPQHAVILMYHRIASPDMDPWGMCVAPEHFSEQLQAIKQIATPMSLVDFVRAQGTGRLPERAVVVTFDDGYIDNLEQALPILRRHGIPATLFVTTCNIDSDREFWWDRLETLLLGPQQLPGHLALELPRGRVEWDLGTATDYGPEQRRGDRGTNAWQAVPGTRLAFYYKVWKTLWPLPSSLRDAAIREITEWAGAPGDSTMSRRTLSSDELRAMAREPLMTIGAHTVDHPPLPAHAESIQADQVRQSQQQLQDIIGAPVTTFAYPHGENSPETIRVLREAGFECAVTVEQKVAGTNVDVMLLPRFGVKDVGGEAFLGQLRRWFGLPAETEATY